MTALLSTMVVLLAFAGGAIHFAVIRHHLEFEVIVAGFAAMGLAQWAVAARMLTRPSASTQQLVVAVHATILGVWVLSRTTGLMVVPGAKEPSAVGLADITASAFSITTIVLVAILHRVGRERGHSRRTPMYRGLAVTLGMVVLALAAPAAVAPHHHDHEPSPAPSLDGGDHSGDHEHGQHEH